MNFTGDKTIGVAIATYNGEKYIRELLASIERQTMKPCLISISDDASTDTTLAIIEEFSLRSQIPVKLIASTERAGVISNFVKAFSTCDADYIAYCDQDDVWEDNRLFECAKVLEDRSISLVFHQSRIVNENLSYIDTAPTNVLDGHYKFPYFPDYIWGYGHQMIFRRDALDILNTLLTGAALNKRLPLNFDLLIPTAAGAVGDIYFIRRELINFRRHGGATSPAGINSNKNDNTRQSKLENLKKSIERVLLIVDELMNINLSSRDARLGKAYDIYLAHLKSLQKRYSQRLSLYAAGGRLSKFLTLAALAKNGAYGSVKANRLPIRYFLADLVAIIKF